MTLRINLTHAFPSNKFYPPRVNDSQILLREGLLTNKLPGKNRAKKIIVVEAQAGQGKTTLIYQYITRNNYLYCWYRVDVKDIDPVLFLTALYSNLTDVIPGFTSPELARVFNEGAVDIYNMNSYANILLSDIDKYCTDEIHLVFDDLHFIDLGKNTNQLLDYIIETSPPKVHFILSSRHPLQLENKILSNKQEVIYLTTADLSLNVLEIEKLFDDIFHQPINIRDAHNIRNITDGWIMGIILTALDSAAKETSTGDASPSNSISSIVSQAALSKYIHDEIFCRIFRDMHRPFLMLSLLNELPVDLAMRITGMDDLEERLHYFAKSNYFIYQLDEKQQTFCFHHLFQEYLQAEARKQLLNKDIQAVFIFAADYYLEKKNIYEALACFFKAEKFESMENLLQKEGIGLLAQNLNISILSLLNKIPEEILHKHGWLCLFAGILGEISSPQKIQPLLEAARERFISQNQEVGELLALAQLVYFHFVVSGLYRKGAELLPRVEQLLTRNLHNLTLLEKIMAARNLAAGLCFFTCNMEKAKKYATMAKDIATKLSIVNFITSSRFVLGYIAFFSGNRGAYLEEADHLYTLLPDPVIGMQNKLSLLFMHLGDLSMHGDHANFIKQVQVYKSKVDARLSAQTIAAPFLSIYQCLMHISQGDIEKGLEAVNEGISVSEAATTPHMSSQLLQWRAYIYSILGNMDDAIADLDKASRLRDIAGGYFYVTLHLMIKGAVYGSLDKKDEAEHYFSRSLEMAQAIPSPYMTVCNLMHRAFLHIQHNNKESALQDLAVGLETMRENGYSYFWSWEPSFMKTLLTTAVTNNIEREFAQKLARSRLDINISDDGTVVPLLHFTMLGGFSIRHKKKKLFSPKELSEKQRELLDLLLTEKQQQVKVNDILVALWPESLPEKSRLIFDSLNSRLRKTLSPKLQVPVKHYLMIKNSVLYLNNCTIDSEEFIALAEEGLDLARMGKYWQAGNCFHSAFSLWKGHLPHETFHSESAITYSYAIEDKLNKISLVWAGILAKSGLIDGAIEVLERVIHRFRENDALISCLYELYRRNNNPLKANKLLKRYRKELLKNDFQDDEIDACITDIITNYENRCLKNNA